MMGRATGKAILAMASAMLVSSLLAQNPASAQTPASTQTPAPPSASAPAPIYELTKVAGNVWRFRSNAHYGLVLVTPAGAVVVDPINRDAARWLKGELARRFNGLKVAEVVYSHHDWDHATGAAEFGKVPVVARAETLAALKPPADPAEREKFLQRFGGVVPPTVTYTGAVKRITLGGRMLELHAVKSRHASDLSYIWFPAEKILMTVDIISAHTLPYRTIDDYELADFNASLDRAAAFKARYIVGGHGRVGTPQDIVALRHYYADLRKGVADGIAHGLSLEAIKKSVTLDAYRDWQDYATFREMNIEGMYKLLTRKG